MAAIAPWLQPTDVLGAMSRGAQLGLAQRSQWDTEAREQSQEAMAADRLRLAYDQMAMEERRASEAAQARQQQASAALLLRKQEAEMLNEFRKGELATRAAAQALQAQHFDELKRHNMAMEGKPRLHNVAGVGLVQENADGTIKTVMPKPDQAKEPTPEQKARLGMSAASGLAKFSEIPPTTPGGIQASNLYWNMLDKYGGLPPLSEDKDKTTEMPALGKFLKNLPWAKLGVGGLLGGPAGAALLGLEGGQETGAPALPAVPGTNAPFKILSIRPKGAAPTGAWGAPEPTDETDNEGP